MKPFVLSRREFLAASAIAAAGCSRNRPGFTGFAFVANEEGRAIAAVDLTAFAVVRHIRLDAPPTQLVSHPSRKAVYALTPETGTVHEISVAGLRRERWLGACSTALDLKLGSRALWVLAREPRQLVAVRLEDFEPETRIALPREPADFDLSPQTALVNAGQSVLLIDLDTRRIREIDCGGALSQVRFRKDGRQFVVAHRDSRMLSIFDTVSGRLVVRLPLAMRPENLCYKSDGGQLFITGEGMDAVAIVFPYSTEVAETVLAGHTPGPMAASPPGAGTPELLFVTNPRSGQVTILSIETRKVVAVAQVGAEPSHVAITPNNQYALVLNRQSGDMAVILVQSAAKRTKFPAALLTMIPVGSKPVAAVVQTV